MQIGDFVKGIPGAPYLITNECMTRGVVTEVDGGKIKVKVLEHSAFGEGTHYVDPKYFEVIGHVKPFNRAAVLELLNNGCKKAILDYDLSGTDLRRANLSEANLSGANLREANLRGANLRGADLREADLREANLREANLREADLRRANLSGADLSGAYLRGADLDFSCLPLKCGGLHWKIDKRLACQLAYHLCSMQCDDAEYLKMRNSILDFANQFHRVQECGVLMPTAEETQEQS